MDTKGIVGLSSIFLIATTLSGCAGQIPSSSYAQASSGNQTPERTYSQESPDVTDPRQKAVLQQFVKFQPQLESDSTYAMPATTPELPCPVAEIDLYRILGLNQLHPELRAEQEKQTRKALRLSGYASNNMSDSYSNIRVVPVKVQCVSGKLDGNLEFLVSYNKVTVINSSTPLVIVR